MKPKLFFVFLILGALIVPFAVSAEEPNLNLEVGLPSGSPTSKLPAIVLFHGEECPHCQMERKFLSELKTQYPDLQITEYEIYHNEANQKMFLEKAKELKLEQLYIPLTIISGKFIQGFGKSEITGEQIKELLGLKASKDGPSPEGPALPLLPFKERIKKLSLPLMTVAFGALDGFNPCSMWSLIVMLMLVIATGSRKKVWIVGGTFIIVSSISYFLFMTAWLKTFAFLGLIPAIRTIVGLIALASGIISIREFYTSKPDVCEIGSSEDNKNKIMKRIEKVMAFENIWWLVVGVAGVAFSVNLIEMMCSLGLPMAYTQALAMRVLPGWEYYAYIALYVFFYMILNILVVAVAGFTMKFMQITNKYSHWFRLLAGILMVILGVLFIFKPDLLMFK